MELTVHCDCCNTDITIEPDDIEHYRWKCEGCGRTYRVDIEHVEKKAKKERPELIANKREAHQGYRGIAKIRHDYYG